ncbi:MAG: DUF4340 domain-containing protein [Propionibacteriaceae bacterium]|nr:DUF4340 domain-containing protein [Propionibacteriaceae bacterium]
MKNTKGLIVVGALLAVCIAAYFGLRAWNEQTAADEEAQAAAAIVYVTDISADEITAFAFAAEGQTVSFTKTDDTWTYDADTSIDIDESAVTTLLGNLDHLQATQAVTAEPDVDYGMETPQNIISYTTSSETVSLRVGMANPVSGDYYLQAGDNLYLVSSSLVTAFTTTVADLTVVPEETATPTPTP